jgi:shikimate kinase
MGCGKTTIGKILAKRHQKRFIDIDHEMVRRTGVAITTIFEIEGEAAFRDRETALLAELAQERNVLLATGGGVVMREQNRAVLQAEGTVVYLHAQPKLLWHRLMAGSGFNSRPILKSTDPLQKLTDLYALRDVHYRAAAHHIVDIEEGKPAHVVGLVERALDLSPQ